MQKEKIEKEKLGNENKDKKDKKNKKERPSAIFICQQCRLPCVAVASSWYFLFKKSSSNNVDLTDSSNSLSSSSNKNNFKRSNTNKPHSNTVSSGNLINPSIKIDANAKNDINLSPPEPNSYIEKTSFLIYVKDVWAFQSQYDDIISEIRNVRNIDFPLCDSCMKSALLIGYCQVSLSQILRIYSFQLNLSNGNFVAFDEDIKYRIQSSHVENRNFHKARKMTIDQKIAPSQPQRAIALISDDLVDSPSTNNSLKTPRNKQNISFKACTLHTVFSFSYNRHYSTINGFRLGTLTPDTVTRTEVDTALFFLCQFVIFLGKMVGVNVKYIRTNLYMEAISENETFAEVHLPSPKSKKKKYELFNSCMETFFNVCYTIFSKPCINESYRRPPFLIDLTTKKIGDVPFKFSKKDPSRWTHAMRLLTIDLKTIQYLALENFVNSVDVNF